MSFDQEDYDRALANVHDGHGREEFAPTREQKLGRFTLVALPLNRTIGSGIFVTPALILKGTGSVSGSLLLWTAGATIATAGLLVWLELGLSVPRQRVRDGSKRSVPRSGGEKNYLEYIFPHILTTCMYGIVFIILGNLSGNAIAFGIYVMSAAGSDEPSRGPVIGLAIGALTTACLVHTASRRGGIILNNSFAVVKVLILLIIIIFGFMRAAGYAFGGHANPATHPTHNFDLNRSFQGDGQNVPSFADSLLFIVYTFSGFEQPFYVLSEVKAPRRRFPKYTLIAMLIASLLFLLVNIAYLCVVPKNQQLGSPLDMATLFFRDMFGEGAAPKAMASLIAFSIFGNLVVMTFTASRVKQEIAKEGIIPKSLFFATGRTTFVARMLARWQHREPVQAATDHLEQTPIPALGLHWFSSIFLIAVTSCLKPRTAYSVLTSLYSYVIVVLMGFLVSGGLLLLHLNRRHDWARKANFRPLGKYPIHAFIYFIVCGFLLFAAFARPSASSAFSKRASGLQWYIVPSIGTSTLLWGVIWWFGIQIVSWKWQRQLVVTRIPNIIVDPDDPDQHIMVAEIVDHAWLVVKPRSESSSEDRLRMTRTGSMAG